MVYLNFANLDSETQERLLSESKEDVESRSGTELCRFAETDVRTMKPSWEMKRCEIYTIMISFSICES